MNLAMQRVPNFNSNRFHETSGKPFAAEHHTESAMPLYCDALHLKTLSEMSHGFR